MVKKQQAIVDPYIKEAMPRLISQFEKLAPKKLKERENGCLVGGVKVEGWRALALLEATHLKQTFPDSKPIPTYGRAQNGLRMLRKYAFDNYRFYLEDPEMAGRVRTTMVHFFDALSFLFSEYKKVSNEQQRQRIDNLQYERQAIKPAPYVSQAESVLRMVEAGQKPHWADVSCALALVTGRRMAEIHQTAKFELGSDDQLDRRQKLYCKDGKWLWFSGQLKGKEDNNLAKRKEHFPIPTLVEPELVILGLSYLANHEPTKRVPESEATVVVNKKFSVQLMRQVDAKWRVDPRPKDGDEKVKFSYHNLRDVYFLVAVHQASIEPFNYPMVAPSILGHSGVGSLISYQVYRLVEEKDN